MTWYHGGKPGLIEGTKILPRAQTGAEPSIFTAADGHDTEGEWVYLTKNLTDAQTFAAAWMSPLGGSVYRVQPAEDLEGDPYYLGPARDAQRCSSATILEVVHVRLPPDLRMKIRSALGQMADLEDLMGPEVGSTLDE